MKTFKYILSIILITTLIWSCNEEEFGDTSFVDSIAVPTNVSAGVNVVPDNSGLTLITPTGDGVASYVVDFGDGSDTSESLAPGEYAEHVYVEGTYEATITATNLKGKSAEGKQTVVVSFRAPENMVITAEIDSANPFSLNVSATADFASSFLVYFDTSNPDEVGTPLEIDGTVSNEYASVGDYTIKVVALSGGAETSELEQQVTISSPIVFPINFEVFDTSAFIGFGGASATVIDNPKTDGNASAKVGEIVKGGPESWAGNVITMSSPIDFSNRKAIKMNVWSPRSGGKLILKIENINDANINIEKEVTLNGNSNWEEVTFDLSDIDESQSYQKLVFFFDFGVVGAGGTDWTFYVDDINQTSLSNGSSSNGVTPLTFEAELTLDAFDGGATSVVDNPDTNGNTSTNVLQLVKDAGQTWAGSKITIPLPFDVSNTTVTAKVWSPRVGLNLLLKFEDATPWPNTVASAEITATTTVASGWEELTFDFSGISTSVDFTNLVLIMDNGTEGDGSSNYTIYVDDISTSPKLDFEPAFILDAFDGGATSVVDNPDTNGNTSTSVLQLIKNAGQTWAGSKITVPSPFSFTGGTSVKVKVWSPRTGLNLLLKFEDATLWPNTVASSEITATTTVADGWEELTFNFSGISTSVDFTNLVLIMDNGTEGDGSSNYTIYVDDISQF
jgi:hypothetical protein